MGIILLNEFLYREAIFFELYEPSPEAIKILPKMMAYV